MPVLLGVLAVLAVGGGIAAAIINGNLGAGAGGSTPPAPQQAATSAPAPSAPTSTPAAPGDVVAFVQNYYGLLPGDTDAAWQLLSPEAQRVSGGRDSYDGFWATVESVSLQNVRQTGENTVEGTVVFDLRNGGTAREPHRFVMGTGPDGQTIMQSFSRL
jgi:hypothetical protein